MAPLTVLLIEDNPIFLGLLTAFLERARPRPVDIAGTARTGAEGLALFQRLRPGAVVVDLKLPDVSGLDVIARLRSDNPRIAIVALSGAEPDSFREPALAAGADAFVSKDNLNTDLLPALRQAVRGRGQALTLGEHADG